MDLFYQVPIITSVILGTCINGFLTWIMGNRLASIQRALFFTLCKLALLFILGSYFWFYEFWVVLLFAGYFFIFVRVYRVPYARAVRFLFFSTVFSASSRVLIAPGISDWIYYLAY